MTTAHDSATMPIAKRQLIVCQTPLHFLLSLACIDRSCEDVIYLFICESQISENFVAKIVDAARATLLTLPGANDLPSQLQRTRRRISNLRVIKNSGIMATISSVLVFHDSTPETQFLLRAINRNGGRTALGEDGVAIYSVGGNISSSLWKRLFGLLVYGWWWSPQKRIGLNRDVSILYATMPTLVRSDISVRSVERLSLSRQLVVEYFGDTVNRLLSKLDASCLCIIPHIESTGFVECTEYVNCIKSIFPRSLFKFHPREVPEVVEQAMRHAMLNPQQVLPANLPAEIYCLASRRPLPVVGFRSSALHIIKSIDAEVDVRYYESHKGEIGAMWRTFYEASGIVEIN